MSCLTMFDAAATKKRCEAATPAPWVWTKTADSMEYGILRNGDEVILSFSGPVLEAHGGQGALGDWGALSISEADAEFCAHARSDLPAALEALEEAQGKLDAVRELRDEMHKAVESEDPELDMIGAFESLDRILRGSKEGE